MLTGDVNAAVAFTVSKLDLLEPMRALLPAVKLPDTLTVLAKLAGLLTARLVPWTSVAPAAVRPPEAVSRPPTPNVLLASTGACRAAVAATVKLLLLLTPRETFPCAVRVPLTCTELLKAAAAATANPVPPTAVVPPVTESPPAAVSKPATEAAASAARAPPSAKVAPMATGAWKLEVASTVRELVLTLPILLLPSTSKLPLRLRLVVLMTVF